MFKYQRNTLFIALLAVAAIVCVLAIVMLLYDRYNSKTYSEADLIKADSLLANKEIEKAMEMYSAFSAAYRPDADYVEKVLACQGANSQSYVYCTYFNDNHISNICNNRALLIAENIDNPGAACSISYNIGNYYENYGDTKSALENYNYSLDLALENKLDEQLNLSMSQILMTIAQTGQIEQIESAWSKYAKTQPKGYMFKYNEYLKDAIIFTLKLDFLHGDSIFEVAKTTLSDALKSTSISSGFEESKDIGTQNAILAHLLQVDLCKANIAILQDRNKPALKILEEIEVTAKQTNSTRIQQRACEMIQRLARHNSDSVLFNFYRYKSDSISEIYASRIADVDYEKMAARTKAESKTDNRSSSWPWITALIVSAFTAAVVSALIIRQKRNNVPAEPKKSYSTTNLTTDEKSEIYARIIAFYDSSTEYFNPNFSIKQLAAAIGTHDRICSQVINECADRNFSTLLAEYRIKEACKRLKSDAFNDFTIEAIANGVGFSSGAYFSRVFKNLTGVTPKEYMQSDSEAKK